jgi:molybdopterin-binding protein
MKVSGRNKLKGVVKQVEKDARVAKVKLEVSSPVTITAVISREAVEELDLKPGDKAEALIKATEVMIAVE